MEPFAQMREDLPNRHWFGDECDQPDIAAAPRARKRKLLPHPGHEFRPRDPGGVVRAGLCRHFVIPVPVLPRQGDEIGEPVLELKRRAFAHAVGSRPRGLPPASRADPVRSL
jgi:hypothetical protein